MKSTKDSQSEKVPAILIDNETTNEDGSVTVSYVINNFALELCAKEYGKDIEDLTEPEIHTYVTRNLSSALKGHDNWQAIKVNHTP